MPWNDVYKELTRFAETHDCKDTLPPKPLILAGWAYSNDIEKKNRWEETVKWAENNGCQELVGGIRDEEFYFVVAPTTNAVGPMGSPMYRSWDFESKERPSTAVLENAMETLLKKWPEVAGNELSGITCPLAFTGPKARRLLVKADAESHPSWGGWTYLSPVESDRRTFTKFRALVNRAISPHEVDHIDFIVGGNAEPIRRSN